MNYYNQRQPINQEQFKQVIPNLNQSFLDQLVRQAKSNGISDKDIEEGLKFIQSLK